MQGPAPTLEQIKTGMRAAWMAGDFGVIARTNVPAAEAFVAALDLPAKARVLDVACGTGNLAIPLARRGATVTGVDLAPNLLEQARARAAAESLSITFDEGDAEQLPYPDQSFSVVVTMFGAMFAPRPQVVAAELARVLVPGGLLAMANWTPIGFAGRMFALNARHVPPPPGIAAPVLWGDPATVNERLTPYFHQVETQPVALDFDLPDNPRGVVGFFRRYFGPPQMAFARLDGAGQQALETDLVDLWAGANIAPDPQTHTLVPNEYLRVTARRT